MARDKSYSIGEEESIVNYVLETFRPEDEALQKARQSANAAGLPDIQVGPMDARHLEVLACSVGATKIVEIGTLGGYSGLCFLRAIAKNLLRGAGSVGKLWTFEIDPKHAEVARAVFKESRFENFEILLGPAIQNLKTIESQGPFDLIFIDADKPNMPQYLEWAVKNVRLGGMIIGDNTFAFGKVGMREKNPVEKTAVHFIHDFNQRMASHPQLCSTLFPTGEGLTVGVRVN